MRVQRLTMGLSLCGLLVLAATARAETKVEVKGVHLCCPACVKAVGMILKDAGVMGKCDQKAGTVTITAGDDKAAQKALDALAAGGFYGDTGSKELTFKEDSGAPTGKVKTLTLTGVHNCCGSCTKAIKDTVKKVDGVKGDTAKAKMDTFEVTGDFDAGALVKALNAAGFHVTVKK
jgi:periplasmic mercuric ion binding protein